MMSSHFQLLEAYEFIKTFITKGLHADGRKLLDFRSTSLQINLFSHADGSALVRHGNTVVVASVKGELSETDFKSADQGRVVLSVSGQPYFTENKQNDLSKASNVIKNLFDTNKIVELKDLCILKGKMCWTLFVDIVCLDCDGAILDACLLSVLSAFHYSSLPSVAIVQQQMKVVGENKQNNDNEDEFLAPSIEEVVTDVDDDLTNFDTVLSNVRVDFNNRKPLKTTHLLPLASTFVLFDLPEGVHLASDPTEDEKILFSNNDFSLIVAAAADDDEENEREILCGLYKYGGTASIDESTLDKCVGLARRRRSQMLRLIREAASSDQKAASAI